MSNEKKLPKAMYRGKLPVGNLELDCYVLDDETRILSTSSVFNALGRTTRGLHIDRSEEYMQELSTKYPNHGLRQVPPFLSSKAIISLLDKDFLIALQPIEFLDGENKMQGYRFEI